MTPPGHTPSPAICQRLSAAGFPIENPILSQILQQLPPSLKADSGILYYLTIVRSGQSGWMVGYNTAIPAPKYQSWLIDVKNASLLEATAELWLKLQSKGILT